jgi:hypothetical protein
MGALCTKIHTVDLNQNGVSDMEEIIDACVQRVLAEVLVVIRPTADADETTSTTQG